MRKLIALPPLALTIRQSWLLDCCSIENDMSCHFSSGCSPVPSGGASFEEMLVLAASGAFGAGCWLPVIGMYGTLVADSPELGVESASGMLYMSCTHTKYYYTHTQYIITQYIITQCLFSLYSHMREEAHGGVNRKGLCVHISCICHKWQPRTLTNRKSCRPVMVVRVVCRHL